VTRLIDHPEGNYRFLPGIAPYSCGVVSKPGFEIVHVTFRQPSPYRQGFETIASFLSSQNCSKATLCGIELRSPKPFTFQGFSDFNRDYTAILQHWGLLVDGVNPVARTSVAPVLNPPIEPVLYGFSFANPRERDAVTTFVVAGGGELPEGVLARDGIVALRDTSDAGIASKSRFVMDLMEARLIGLGIDWSGVNQINVYTRHSLTPIMEEAILKRVGSSAIHGITWHFTMPPIEEIEFEMDLHGTRTNLVL
jgi:hypothetical protein